MKNLLTLFVLLLTITSCATKLKFPKEEASALKLCFLGDVGKATKAQFLVAQALKEEKCHQIFFLGDIIYPNGISDPADPRFVSRFWSYYQDLPKMDNRPSLNIILGNHDHVTNPNAWLQISREIPKIYFPHHHYWQKIKDICLVALDSNRKNYDEQIEWLKTERPKWKECRYLVAMAQHPLFTNGPNHPTSLPVLKEFYDNHVIGKFDFLIVGHEHIVEYLGTIKGTELFVSGAGGALARGYKPGYMTIEKMTEKEGEALTIKLKTIEKDGEVKIRPYTKAN